MTNTNAVSTQVVEPVESSAAEFPSSGAIVVRSLPPIELQSPADVSRAMKDFDDQVFLAELMGEAIEAWFYNFKIQGKDIQGVSAQGAHEFARIRAEQGYPIRFPVEGVRLEEVTENNELGMRATVIARDGRTQQEGIGMAFYPHYELRKDDRRAFDKMAGRKALSVAERNAILRLIPEAAILAVLKERERLVAQNAQRNEVAREQAFANAQRHAVEPRRTVVERGQKQLPAPDPYTVNDVAAAPRRPRTKAGEFKMPFGKTKGTALADLDEAEVRSALAWAVEKGKFDEFQAAAKAHIAELEAPAPESQPAAPAVVTGSSSRIEQGSPPSIRPNNPAPLPNAKPATRNAEVLMPFGDLKDSPLGLVPNDALASALAAARRSGDKYAAFIAAAEELLEERRLERTEKLNKEF